MCNESPAPGASVSLLIKKRALDNCSGVSFCNPGTEAKWYEFQRKMIASPWKEWEETQRQRVMRWFTQTKMASGPNSEGETKICQSAA